MKVLKELCSIPTAPFVEDRVVDYVRRFVAQRPKLRLRSDRHGNLMIELPGRKSPRRGARHARWVFGAHMDHPGFVARRMKDPRTLEADFRGGVLAEYFQGTRVRFFDGEQEIPGTVQSVQTEKDRRRPRRALVRVRRAVSPGAPGMFDQGVGRVKGKRFYSRVCDDLAGAAAALAMLDELHARPPAAPVAVLLTRAEEEGFIGAIAAATDPILLRKTDLIIAIECSAEQPFAPQGSGAIIRIGDRTSVFNSGLSYFITNRAEDLMKRDSSFKYQRALMPGGTCEATVYDVYGFTAASICVALGNYHNMDRQREKIGPEYVDLEDWRNMVKLFVHLARTGHAYAPGHRLLKQRLEKRFERLRDLL
jgi:putative aminopeptidase FrvX